MNNSFKLKAISMAIISAGIHQTSYAQEQKESATDVEVIEVTGFRGSIIKAQNSKRFAEEILDSIHAEDIGKSTDQNIGDALSRVTGLTVEEVDGEGTKISARGAAADFNQISLNGVTLTSGNSGDNDNVGGNQAVDLSAFSADILSSIDVYKTAAADHNEGSLGANVILRTAKPLRSKPSRSFEIQTRYNDFIQKNDQKVSFSFSDKFFDETLGINFTFADETQESRSDKYSANWKEDAGYLRPNGARDAITGEIIDHTMYVVSPHTVTNSLNLNSRDRQSFTSGFQLAPSDDTNIQLTISGSKQEVTLDTHSINARGTVTEHEEQGNNNTANFDTDRQQDWWTIDQNNYTLVKNLNRYNTGAISRGIGGQVNKSKVVSLEIEHYFTDSFSSEIKAGYSRTDYETIDNYSANTANWNSFNAGNVGSISSDDIEPVGYDCSTGLCTLVFGQGEVFTNPEETGTNALEGTTAYNPLDPYASHLSRMTLYDNNTSDVNKSLFWDFDWEVEYGPINKVEFGFKVANRAKNVNAIKTTVGVDRNPIQGADGVPEAPNFELSDLLVVDMLTTGAFPVNDFMADIVPNRDQPYLNGWGIIDPKATYETLFDDPGSNIGTDPRNSRDLNQDTTAQYVKLSFELLDSRLTGNIGLRHVKTAVDASSYSSVKFDSGSVITPYDLIFKRGLADTNQPACDTLTPVIIDTNNKDKAYYYDPIADIIGADDGFTQCHDALITHPSGDLNQNPFIDINYVYDNNGNIDPRLSQIITNDSTASNINDSTRTSGSLTHWRDLTTYGNIDELPGELQASIFGQSISESEQRNFLTSDKASSEIWLPSLNLNYTINNEMIGRFAISKTMSRPRFDDMRPGILITENVFDSDATGTASSTQLKPLESKNIDFSWEWYFNESSLVAVTLFRKDMENFVQTIEQDYYWRDIRTDYALTSILPSDLLIPANTGISPADDLSTNEGIQSCMPERMKGTDVAQAWQFDCNLLTLEEKRNGQKSVTQGLEFTYNQTYDFLPGALSGLGLSMNYTYAKSENDPEFLESKNRYETPLPQANTPKHSANTNLYWDYGDFSLRFTHRYKSILLKRSSVNKGSEWQDATTRVDFNANYKLNKTFTLSFHALNLTDDITRTFYTSKNRVIPGRTYETDGVTVKVPGAFFNGAELMEDFIWDEGNPMEDDSVDKSRTLSMYKTGIQYRLSLRAKF